MSRSSTRPRKRVFSVGYFRFPEENPGAYRALGIAKTLRYCGYEVVFAGAERAGRPEDVAADGRFYYEGFRYESMAEYQENPRSLVRRASDYVASGCNTIAWLRKQDTSDVCAVVSYNALSSLGWRLRRFCRERRIPWVTDITEWYEAPLRWGGRIGPRSWDVEFAMRVLNRRAGNVIAISSFLERFHAHRGVHTIRVPTLIDLGSEKWPPRDRPLGQRLPLRFVYAGQAGLKDALENVLAGFSLARKQGLPVALHLCGMEREKIVAIGNGVERLIEGLGSALTIHGRLPSPADAIALMASCDAALLVKRPCRLVDAQFPTKLTQYMAVGLPVLANRTGDVGKYVRDGREGFLSASHRPEDIASTLERFSERRVEMTEIGRQSRMRAAECFEYKRYGETLGRFFSNLRPAR